MLFGTDRGKLETVTDFGCTGRLINGSSTTEGEHFLLYLFLDSNIKQPSWHLQPFWGARLVQTAVRAYHAL